MSFIKTEIKFQDLSSDVLILIMEQMQEKYFQKAEEVKKEKLRNAILSMKSNRFIDTVADTYYAHELMVEFKNNEIKRLQTQLKIKTSQMIDFKKKYSELSENYKSVLGVLKNSTQEAHLIVKDEKRRLRTNILNKKINQFILNPNAKEFVPSTN